MAYSILIVDDEVKITQVLDAYLQKKGFETFIAHSGLSALEQFSKQNVSLVLLDLMLPDIPGEKICQEIRRSSRVPIIMLTAKAEEYDLIRGLEIGADDYLTKPFSPRTVVAKVEAVLRRAMGDELVGIPVVFGNGYLSIDFRAGTVKVNQEEIKITPTEFRLLRTLAKAPGRVFSRNQLIEFALGEDYDGFDRSIDTYIKSLRAKIEPDRKHPQFILTAHGFGYKFAAGEQ